MTSSTRSTAELPVLPATGERRVRELARDAISVMAFSVGVSISLVLGLVAAMSLVR